MVSAVSSTNIPECTFKIVRSYPKRRDSGNSMNRRPASVDFKITALLTDNKLEASLDHRRIEPIRESPTDLDMLAVRMLAAKHKGAATREGQKYIH